MNSRGQVILFGFMLGITIIILALSLAPAVKEGVDSVRNDTTAATIWNGTDYVGGAGLNCSNADAANLSMVNRATCIASDLTIFQFIAGLIFIGGLVITARILFG